MMKNSKEQLERFLKGYPYHIYVKELRSDDPANLHQNSAEGKFPTKIGSYSNYDHNNLYRNYRRCKTKTNIDEDSMYVIRFTGMKSGLNIDEISVFVSPRGISATLFRTVKDAKEPQSYTISFMGEDCAYQPQLESLEQDLNRKIQDQLVWSDFDAGFDSRIIRDAVLDYDTSSDPGLILGLTTKRVYDSSNLPDLLKLSKVLDGLEKIVRDSLE